MLVSYCVLPVGLCLIASCLCACVLLRPVCGPMSYCVRLPVHMFSLFIFVCVPHDQEMKSNPSETMLCILIADSIV